MQKIIHSGQSDQIIDRISLPRSRDKCKLTPHQNTRSGRFKRSAIINGLTTYDKIHPEIRGIDPTKCSKIMKNQGIFTKPNDLTGPRTEPPKKTNPKSNKIKDNLETCLHLVRKLMDEAPDQNLNEAIMDMEEQYDLSEFWPFWHNQINLKNPKNFEY